MTRTRTLTLEQDWQIANEYTAGATYNELAQKWGISTTSIAAAARRGGAIIRRGGFKTQWSSEFEAEALRMYESGISIRAIASHFTTRGDNIKAVVDSAGITRHPGGSDHPCFATDAQKLQVRERYEAGASLKSLAVQYGCSTQPVKRAILKVGGSLRPVGVSRIWTDEMIAWAIEAYQCGKSQEEIAQHVGVHQTSVSAHLRVAGVLSPAIVARGPDHGSWRGGRSTTKAGYVMVRLELEDPLYCMTNSGNYVMEHRLVMARSLGRPLISSESVHHKNGIHDDNRLENLQLRHGNHGTGVAMVCLDCGSHNVHATSLALVS